MKNLKFFFVLLLSLLLVFTLASCGEPCTEHVDADKNGKCDNCKTEVPIVCDEHEDANEDYICDVCGEELEAPLVENSDLTLIEDGEVLFRIVSGSDLNSDSLKQITKFVSGLKKLDLEVESVDFTSEADDTLIEVLVGTVTTRGDAYYVDPHTLGEEGYLIKSIGNKIIVIGGSPEETADALEMFIEKLIGYTSKTKELDNVTIESKQWKEKPQTKFNITSISVGGEEMKGYNIAVNTDAKAYETVALTLQSTLYSRAGLWLDIVPFDKATEKSILIKKVAVGEAGENGFRVFVDGTKLVLECAHDNKLEDAMDEFISEILYAKDELKFGSNYIFDKVNIAVLHYEDFGAKGDGRTNDYAAIKATHDEANKGGQTVLGKAGATYYISSTANASGLAYSILIRTNTNWNGAKFIFDDSEIVYSDANYHESTTPIFDVASDTDFYRLNEEDIAKINAHLAANGPLTFEGTNMNIGMTFPCDVMLLIYDNTHRCYVRYGGNANDGNPQQDIILVDKDGNIDPSTPILFDYSLITSAKYVRLDQKPVTVENATIECIGNKVNLYKPDGKSTERYLNRSLKISRPNTTIRNITNVNTGEIQMGTPVYAGTGEIAEGYHYDGKLADKGVGKIVNSTTNKEVTDGSIVPFMGYSHTAFLLVAETSNVLVESCVFQAKMYYNAGSYAISVNRSNNVRFKDCTQSNFWYEASTGKFYAKKSDAPAGVSLNVSGKPCWGTMGSNFAKNLIYDNTSFVRFDAHCGLVNGQIINGSTVGVLRITGGGQLDITDSTLYFSSGNSIILLREDYGATFKGTINMKNVDVVCPGSGPTAFMRGFNGNHEYGNGCYVPNLVIDDVRIVDEKGNNKVTEISIMADYGVSIPDGAYDENGNPSDTVFHNRGVNDPIVHIKGAIYYYEVKDASGNVIKTIEIPNVNPYYAPEYLEVKNNSQNGYQVYLKSYPFWMNTETRGDIVVR